MSDGNPRRWRDNRAVRLLVWLLAIVLLIWPFPWLPL